MPSMTSIVVPVFDPHGSQKARVIRMAKSIAAQSQAPREVVFTSSHYILYEGEIRKILDKRTKCVFVKNFSASAPENLNDGISHAQYEVIKILFQDDFLIGDDHLEDLESTFLATNSEWAVSSSIAFVEESNQFLKRITPRFKESLVRGVNKIGAPSVVVFRARSFVPFKENLSYLFDCEWYLCMQHNFGNPTILSKNLVGIGIHQDQATWWARSFLKEEKKLLLAAHRKTRWAKPKCRCVQIP